jgi:hypothetical protein
MPVVNHIEANSSKISINNVMLIVFFLNIKTVLIDKQSINKLYVNRCYSYLRYTMFGIHIFLN